MIGSVQVLRPGYGVSIAELEHTCQDVAVIDQVYAIIDLGCGQSFRDRRMTD
jgi:hypothetical protein